MIVASNMASRNSNRRVAISLGTLVLVMVGLSYASVPLYDLFCRVTGYGGTTQVADAKSNQIVFTDAVWKEPGVEEYCKNIGAMLESSEDKIILNLSK